MTLESLARTIAKARHGTDAHWAHYIGAAESVLVEFDEWLSEAGRHVPCAPETTSWLRQHLAQPGRAQSLRPGLKREAGGLASIDPTRFPFDEAEDY